MVADMDGDRQGGRWDGWHGDGHGGWQVALFDISISDIDCRYIDININIDKDILENIDIDIDKNILENIDIDINIDKEILENIDIVIVIDKEILENINIDKISNRLEFGISNSPTAKQTMLLHHTM